ncbi:MAG: plastocyanin/azurin family copper-binding protein [Gaiellaceae bacterium]
MRRHIWVFAVTAVALALPVSAQAANKLTATVGPGFTITLKMGGKKVTRLKAGKYRITVQDKSNIHNFHLKGGGVNKKSGVAARGTKTWTVTLKKGTYTYVCDPHKSSMKGSFKVV